MRSIFSWLSGKFSATGPNDPRWKSITGTTAKCPCCGEACSAILSIAYDRPDVCPSDIEKEANAAIEREGDILTADFCRLGEDRLVRCVLEVPLLGLDESFTVGVWSSLSQPNYARFVETFDHANQSELGEMTSWLCNPVPGDTQNPTAVWMIPQDNRQRPKLAFADKDHPLYQAQNSGLSYDGFVALIKTYGHDITSAPD